MKCTNYVYKSRMLLGSSFSEAEGADRIRSEASPRYSGVAQ